MTLINMQVSEGGSRKNESDTRECEGKQKIQFVKLTKAKLQSHPKVRYYQ